MRRRTSAVLEDWSTTEHRVPERSTWTIDGASAWTAWTPPVRRVWTRGSRGSVKVQRGEVLQPVNKAPVWRYWRSTRGCRIGAVGRRREAAWARDARGPGPRPGPRQAVGLLHERRQHRQGLSSEGLPGSHGEGYDGQGGLGVPCCHGEGEGRTTLPAQQPFARGEDRIAVLSQNFI